jgi:hypothetical protein
MNFTLALDPMVTLRDVNGQTVLFSRTTGDFYGLNPTGGYLIRQLMSSDFERTTRAAAAELDVDEERVRDDLDEMVAALVKARLAARVPVSR